MGYVLHLAIIICIYSILAISLDLIAGHTGLISLASAAFYAVGAYTSAVLTERFAFPVPLAALAGMLLAAAFSLFVSIPSLRLRDDYFVICTFGFQIISSSIFNNCVTLTGGPLGINNIPQPTAFGLLLRTKYDYLMLVTAGLVFSYAIFRRLILSPYGRVLHSIREDEILSECLGKNTHSFKVSAVAVSSSLAALAGALYAHYVGYIDPTSFTVNESILILSMVVIGGAGSVWGSLTGAALLVLLPEALRFLGLPAAFAANLRQIVYGSCLVMLMVIRPRGILGKFDFGANRDA